MEKGRKVVSCLALFFPFQTLVCEDYKQAD